MLLFFSNNGIIMLAKIMLIIITDAANRIEISLAGKPSLLCRANGRLSIPARVIAPLTPPIDTNIISREFAALIFISRLFFIMLVIFNDMNTQASLTSINEMHMEVAKINTPSKLL